jgi:undecaprenyl-phosphate 4-deoxy-4-formamido-L-arabinose transferase
MFVNFSVMPLRLSTFTGFALALLGLFGFTWVVLEAILSETPPGWASLAAAVLLLSGVQLMILGLFGEYLGRLYLSINRKPQSIVRDVERSEAPARRVEAVAERAAAMGRRA